MADIHTDMRWIYFEFFVLKNLCKVSFVKEKVMGCACCMNYYSVTDEEDHIPWYVNFISNTNSFCICYVEQLSIPICQCPTVQGSGLNKSLIKAWCPIPLHYNNVHCINQ